MRADEVFRNNQAGWDRRVEEQDVWTRPVSPDEVARARRGDWAVVLTPHIPVPRDWFGDIQGRDILCLASGGGQQGPILAAAGARVTVFDASARQLRRAVLPGSHPDSQRGIACSAQCTITVAGLVYVISPITVPHS